MRKRTKKASFSFIIHYLSYRFSPGTKRQTQREKRERKKERERERGSKKIRQRTKKASFLLSSIILPSDSLQKRVKKKDKET